MSAAAVKRFEAQNHLVDEEGWSRLLSWPCGVEAGSPSVSCELRVRGTDKEFVNNAVFFPRGPVQYSTPSQQISQ